MPGDTSHGCETLLPGLQAASKGKYCKGLLVHAYCVHKVHSYAARPSQGLIYTGSYEVMINVATFTVRFKMHGEPTHSGIHSMQFTST